MNVTTLDEARWNRETAVGASDVPTMLRVLLGRIERGEVDATHVICCVGTKCEGGAVEATFLQEGGFSPFEQMGLLARIQQILFVSA